MKWMTMTLLLCLLVGSKLFAQPQPSGNGGSYNDEFGVLSERNMFVKDRVRGRGDGSSTRPSSTQPGQSPLTPEESFVLRGVTFDNDAFTAYFENLNTSRIEAVNIGAELAQTRIADIAIDAVLLEKNGQTQWIVIGRDLRGAVARQTVKATPAPITQTPGAASADPATMSIEERLRQRRAAERGGR